MVYKQKSLDTTPLEYTYFVYVPIKSREFFFSQNFKGGSKVSSKPIQYRDRFCEWYWGLFPGHSKRACCFVGGYFYLSLLFFTLTKEVGHVLTFKNDLCHSWIQARSCASRRSHRGFRTNRQRRKPMQPPTLRLPVNSTSILFNNFCRYAQQKYIVCKKSRFLSCSLMSDGRTVGRTNSGILIIGVLLKHKHHTIKENLHKNGPYLY